MKVDGACACGAIRIEAEADAERTQVCHCTDCQTATGTAFRVSLPVAGETLKVNGQPKTYIKTTAESGRPRVQAFCGQCGTPLYSTSPGNGVQPFAETGAREILHGVPHSGLLARARVEIQAAWASGGANLTPPDLTPADLTPADLTHCR